MTSCVFPGSFDPVTIGHQNLIERAAKLFDRVTVTVMINIHKQGTIPPEKRVALLKQVCDGMENVYVDQWNGLLADYMAQRGEHILLRGVRNTGEFENEMNSAAVNRLLNPEMETLLLPAVDNLAAVSSSAVREIAAFGGDIRPYIPAKVVEEIQRLLSNKDHKT